MKRLTTDKPRNNTETALNLFFAKDGETWVRGGSSDPCVHDVTLNEFIRRVAHEHKADELFNLGTNDVELSEQMADALFHGIDTMEGLIATLYTVGWAFAELREKLKRYEDEDKAGKLVHLPCKIGTPVYRIHRVFGECSMSSEAFKLSTLNELGGRVFLTVSEAAEALDDLRKQG